LGKETVLEQMMKRASDRALTNRLDSLMGNIVSRPALTKKDLESLNLDKIAAYYRSLYANPSRTSSLALLYILLLVLLI
jgi:zinc protease